MVVLEDMLEVELEATDGPVLHQWHSYRPATYRVPDPLADAMSLLVPDGL